MRNPVSWQHLGFIGLLGAVTLPDLLSAAFFSGFAKLGSDSTGVDQLLSEGRLAENEGANKKQVWKCFQGNSP